MAKSIYLTADSKSAKRKSINVADKISDATKDISSATKELNNVDYVDVSYEINQLQAMYKSSASQVNEFESFATTLENMVNDYISTDKECATRIKTNGKNHRVNTGLKKNLALATVCASFDKIGNKLDDIADSIENWVDNVIDTIVDGVTNLVDKIVTSITEDWASYLQLAEGVIQIVTSVGILATAIAGAATGGGLIVAGPVLVASLFSLYIGIDKFISSLLYIGNFLETDESTVTQLAVGDTLLFNLAYSFVDSIASTFTVSGLAKLASFTQATELFTFLGKGEFAGKFLNYIQNADKISDMGDYVGYLQDINTYGSIIKDLDIDNIKDLIDKLLDKVKNEAIEEISENIVGDNASNLVETMIKNDNVVGVLGAIVR